MSDELEKCPMVPRAEHADARSGRGLIGIAHDPVTHPAHYCSKGIEPIAVIEAYGLGYCLGNVLKYVLRADLKGRPVEDLRKAAWYLAREIERRG